MGAVKLFKSSLPEMRTAKACVAASYSGKAPKPGEGGRDFSE